MTLDVQTCLNALDVLPKERGVVATQPGGYCADITRITWHLL